MFTIKHFNELYSLLSEDIVSEDCGLKCDKYCCRAENTIKYLLPGEDEYFIKASPNNFQFVEYYLFTSYRAKDQICSCTRELRPFCCRIFPFRPVIDLTSYKVVGLSKVKAEGFDKYCWINQVRQEWQNKAIEAWQKVLSDIDNLQFYARYFLFLEQAKENFACSTTALLVEVNKKLSSLNLSKQWELANNFFNRENFI